MANNLIDIVVQLTDKNTEADSRKLQLVPKAPNPPLAK